MAADDKPERKRTPRSSLIPIELVLPVCECGSRRLKKTSGLRWQGDGYLQYAECKACGRSLALAWSVTRQDFLD